MTLDLHGWGRCATDADGHYAFTTVQPGPVSGGAAFFALTVFARGLLHRLVTRAYPPAAHPPDGEPLPQSLPPERRGTLLAATDATGYRFDIVLQGERETVFLDHRTRR